MIVGIKNSIRMKSFGKDKRLDFWGAPDFFPVAVLLKKMHDVRGVKRAENRDHHESGIKE
jgi:hypothetical protein